MPENPNGEWASTPEDHQRIAPGQVKKIVGYRNDEGKEALDLIPPEIMFALGKALEVGARKYDKRNWEKGMDWSRVFGSLSRHLWKFWGGEDIDEETGLPHTHLILCNAAFLCTYYVRKIGTDNRHKVK